MTELPPDRERIRPGLFWCIHQGDELTVGYYDYMVRITEDLRCWVIDHELVTRPFEVEVVELLDRWTLGPRVTIKKVEQRELV